MIRPPGQHLSEDEMNLLVEAHLGADNYSVREQELVEHTQACAHCKRLLDRLRNIDAAISGLQASEGSKGVRCPEEGEWDRLAAGLTGTAEAAQLLEHGHTCDYCCALLRDAIRQFSDEVSPEEAQILGTLRSAQPDWQKNLAEKLADRVRRGAHRAPRTAVSWRWVFAPAAALALAVLLVVWWYQRDNLPDRLLLQAYSERREIETRIYCSPYVPLRRQRGPAPWPATLYRAQGRIQSELEKRPADARLLAMQGQAQLLERDYDAAIATLTRALAVFPDSAPAKVDLASALLARGDRDDNKTDYGSAVEYLSRVLKSDSDDPVALFNRAIAYDRMALYHEEVLDWERYLRLDSSGGWADEARERLSRVKAKLAAHSRAHAEPLLGSGEFAQVAAASHASPFPRLEEYLDLAMRDWIREAGPHRRGETEKLRALSALAVLVKQGDGDDWLADLLKAPASSFSKPALSALADAAVSNANGNTDAAIGYSLQAVRLFQQAGNQPGLVRARFEHVYSLARAARARACDESANALWPTLPSEYRWLRIQLGLQQGSCLGMLGRFDDAAHLMNAALQEADQTHFGNLRLRARAFAASVETAKGDAAQAWALDFQGLAEYWEDHYPPMRAYQFYDDLGYAADAAGERFLAFAIAREAVEMISATGNRSGEAMARNYLAKCALGAGFENEARIQFELANAMFHKLDQGPATALYRLDGDLGLAKIDLEAGRLPDAEQRLQGGRAVLASTSDDLVALAYYNILGEIRFRTGDYAQAEQYFRSAAEIGERGLRGLRSDADRVAWDREARGTYRNLVQIALTTLHQPDAALDLWEWYKAAPLRSQQAPSPRYVRANLKSPEDSSLQGSRRLQGSLLPGLTTVTVLSYAELRDRWVAWVFDNRGVNSFTVATSRPELERLLEKYQAECSDPASDPSLLKRDARKIYEFLVQPLASRLDRSRTLLIETDGGLEQVPFQALVDEQGRYLGQRFRVVTSPGVLYRQSLHDRRLARSHLLAVGVAGSASAGLPPVSEAVREVQSLAAIFPSAKVLTSVEATRDAVLEALPEADIFHFAGHARETPYGVRLLLSGKGSEISGSEISRRRLRRCQLAVLSACDTGRGGIGSADSFVRAFLRMGVPHVVASRWPVDSSTTMEFMEAFYKGVAEGDSVAGALQSASSRFIAKPATSHPYYWAAFGAFGGE